MLTFFKQTELGEAYSEFSKLCDLVMTIPATSASGEQRFSVLKRIKNFVRNSTSEEMLANLAILSIEKGLIKEMSENPSFYEFVINELAKDEDRRIELHDK
ncbi:unnamed protein product [Diabrotica balteata]|uniref:HAT C-terminal dimerisation domain-containing protein n=1 Tax=Diabrotica balteata TaxID=107213 RepID=A0A9N9TEP5_DIABA|nr:unnamed protein product [Diabrotica balteata]